MRPRYGRSRAPAFSAAISPRAVDAERYASEQKSRQRWHAQQGQDEAEFDQT